MYNIIYRMRRHKHFRRFCRLLLNLIILSLLGFLIWFGTLLFTGRWGYSPLIGGLVFVVTLAGFVWLSKIGLNNSWQPNMKVTVVSLIVLFFIFSFAGVQPMSTYKDILINNVKGYVVDEIPQYVQSPIKTKMSVEEDWAGYNKFYRINIIITPTPTAKLDTMYWIEVSSPYWDDVVSWDVLWTTNPDLRVPQAQGFTTLTHSIVITNDNPLYDHISQLEYRKFVQEYNAWTMSEIEAEYQNELKQLFDIQVIR